ncbi:MAG: gamma-glutamyl-gamma-aminobutyrate hydrolase family protein [Proteobacteria bacterium]|nr:gamma-glutamyl-gamma-aminobutyrate hydrolase family protein [Pseudomonadota bacterium]
MSSVNTATKSKSIKEKIVVVDPAIHTPEIECYNSLQDLSGLKLHYHLPALFSGFSLPNIDESVRGIVLLGSSSSVHDQFDWQETLIKWLKTAIEKNIPILGICFGHQLLAHMHGGKVGFVNQDRVKLVGCRKINFEWPCFDLPKSIQLFATHNEEVKTLPSGFERIASSDQIQFEGLKHKTKPILSLQAHPEATAEFAIARGFSSESLKNALTDGSLFMSGFLQSVK